MKVEFHVTTWSGDAQCMDSLWRSTSKSIFNACGSKDVQMCIASLPRLGEPFAGALSGWCSPVVAQLSSCHSVYGTAYVVESLPLTNYWPESSPNLTHSPPSVLVHSPSFSSQLKPTHLHLLSLHPSSFAPLARLILPALPFDRNVQTSKRCRHSFCLHVHVKTTIIRRLALRNPPHPWRLLESIP